MRRAVFVTLCAVAVASCNTTPKDLNWANKDDPVVDRWAPPTLAIRSTVRAEAKDAAPVSSERAEAATIAEIGRKTDSLKSFREETAAPEKETAVRLDWRRLARTLSVSVQRPNLRMGDRYLKYSVDIRPVNFVFSDIKSVSTVYASVDLGSLESKSEVNTGFKINPTFAGGLVGTGEASTAISNSSDRNRKLAVRVQDPDIEATPTRILILREGAPDRDITGTTTSDLSVEPANYDHITYGRLVKSLKIATSAGFLPPDKAEAKVVSYQYVDQPGLQVCAQLTYYERVVVKGDQHEDPALQTVEPFRAKHLRWQPFIVVQPNEMAPDLWGILDRASGAYLELDDLHGAGAIAFADPVEADQFLRWLDAQTARTVGKATLQLAILGGGRPSMASAKLVVSPLLRPADAVTPDPTACARFEGAGSGG